MKLLVFCIDALCASDISLMREMPAFASLLNRGALVEAVEPVFPALTYCCHTSIITGNYVAKHGITHNEKMARGGKFHAPWHCMYEDIACKTMLDVARERGMSVCALSWPVTGAAGFEMNMPMIVPYSYKGYEPEKWLQGTASDNLMERYFFKHGRHIKGPDRSLDLLTMALALDILENEPQPDIMLVKMCDLDSVRHTYGVYHESTIDQLRKHDEELAAIMEALRRKGTLEETNIVVLGDHGQTDVSDVLLINELLRREGFIRVDDEGRVLDFDAIAHSTGLAAYIELKNPEDAQLKRRVRLFLEGLRGDPEIALNMVMDQAQAYESFRVDGPFDFIIDSARPISFGENFSNAGIWASKEPGDHKIGAATHGGTPSRNEVTAFFAAGPAIKPGAVVKRCSMVDEAPTMARMLGFDMADVDGSPIIEILR